MSRNQMDSATLIERDRLEALANRGVRPAPILPKASMSFSDCAGDPGCACAADETFTDPGKKWASIKKPKVYEALKRKGLSKTRAAKISNAQARGRR